LALANPGIALGGVLRPAPLKPGGGSAIAAGFNVGLGERFLTPKGVGNGHFVTGVRCRLARSPMAASNAAPVVGGNVDE
jgi:hypothetical protein